MPSKKDLDRYRGEIEESIVAYELLKRNWNVMKNLGGHGYDLLAISNDARITRRIEVKTTDPELKTGAFKGQLTVLLTESEFAAADFLVFYIHGHETFFVIPKSAFPASRSVTVNVGTDGKIAAGTAYQPYRNKWDELD